MAGGAVPADPLTSAAVQPSSAHLASRFVLGMRVDQVDAPAARDAVLHWAAQSGEHDAVARTVCAANVHMTMESRDDREFRDIVNGADLVVADGVPMVWALRLLGLPQQRRVRVSPDLLLELFAACEARGLRLGLYGGSLDTLGVFTAFLGRSYPRLEIACAISPPFRPPTADEDARDVDALRAAGVQLLLVGIGCPKQERWMAAHRDRLPCTMFGVGAAFDLLGGQTKNAPAWTHDIGLEWAYRLLLEPRRLWRRYLYHNPRFVLLFARQLLHERWQTRRLRGADRRGHV